MDNITGKLGNSRGIACLSGKLLQRGAEKGECDWLMIGITGKLTGFKEKTEVAD